ncbi:NAD(P)/FAD-dependent oxidoreductase [Streptomyces sp. LP05-1]|uniref:NAD(P)/FAD-dependent oxidoreductase n=1 Tax=Streptomyces pyxinae TaxID=2970734 RepID=A0ABT2CG37_9ACTN|nr:NAD(P)/FAD-dependent oxidoreductase [Streptomyces sp. LP05-1]MCS0636384.1 NAD(P)/FAD-dependent oxidoreductase [Streptomyces sp. LP05-1]
MARIVVIGAGMGAMAAAARLAVAGHRVTVYERAETYGGGVGRFERDGFVFDTGPGLLHLPAVYRDLFVKTGKEPLESLVGLEQVDPASRHLFADGTTVTLPNASRAGVGAALDTALGAGTGERWADFMGRARDAWDRSRRPLLEEPLRPDWQVLGRDPYPAVRQRRLLRVRQAATLAGVGTLELRDARLAALLEWYALGYGLDPRRAPAGAALLAYLEQTFGSWYVRGGLRELARAVYERCLARKVEFVFGAEVSRVAEKDGRAAGVELAGGTVAEADHVVDGTGPDGLPGRPPYREGEVAPRPDPRTGRFTVLLALRGARPPGTPHRTVVHSAGGAGSAEAAEPEAGAVFGGGTAAHPTVTVLRPDDPATRPDEAHEAVTLTATVAAPGPAGGPDWTDPALRERYAELLVGAAGAAVDGLGERLLWREVRTPAETGPVPAPALAGAGGRFLRPANTTRLPGLYAVGGWAHPGGGLAHAGMSGALVAGLIVEGADFRGSR